MIPDINLLQEKEPNLTDSPSPILTFRSGQPVLVGSLAVKVKVIRLDSLLEAGWCMSGQFVEGMVQVFMRQFKWIQVAESYQNVS